MSLGLLGQKLGMTRIFADDGTSIPITVVSVKDNRVTQIKTKTVDGYSAVQVTYGYKKPNRINKPTKGHFAKASIEAGKQLIEFPLSEEELTNYAIGTQINADIFKAGQLVDISGQSKGKGFSGVIKRHNFSSNRASHGNSVSHNSPGSIGQRQDPGRVFPGKKMAGHLGSEQTTQQNLTLIKIDLDRGLLLIKGSIPGSVGTYVVVKSSVKGGA